MNNIRNRTEEIVLREIIYEEDAVFGSQIDVKNDVDIES